MWMGPSFASYEASPPKRCRSSGTARRAGGRDVVALDDIVRRINSPGVRIRHRSATASRLLARIVPSLTPALVEVLSPIAPRRGPGRDRQPVRGHPPPPPRRRITGVTSMSRSLAYAGRGVRRNRGDSHRYFDRPARGQCRRIEACPTRPSSILGEAVGIYRFASRRQR